MVEPLWLTIAKGVFAGIVLVEVASVAGYYLLAWLYRRVR